MKKRQWLWIAGAVVLAIVSGTFGAWISSKPWLPKVPTVNFSGLTSLAAVIVSSVALVVTWRERSASLRIELYKRQMDLFLDFQRRSDLFTDEFLMLTHQLTQTLEPNDRQAKQFRLGDL